MGSKKEIPYLVATALSLALALNGFFIKRLVDQIDSTNKIALEVQADIKVIKAQLAFGSFPFLFDKKPVFFKRGKNEKNLSASVNSASFRIR